MPEIGATLREARMRARIDISEVEAETKIRAKYLRALENEEWNLLPGPTYVRSFLRTYAEFLGLDAKLLVEEYKLRHDRTPEHELPPISPQLGRDRRQPGTGEGIGRGTVVVLLLIAVAVVVSVLNFAGRGGSGSKSASERSAATVHRQTTHTTPAHKAAPPAAAPSPTEVRLRLVPTGRIWVCLVDAGGKALVNGDILEPGTTVPTFTSSSFRMTLGNGDITLEVNGKPLSVPQSASAIGYQLTPKGRTTLPPPEHPTCG